METNENIKYDKEVLNLIESLSKINEKFLIKKSDDGKSIVINTSNRGTTIAYQFEAPVDSFDFSGEEVGFYNYDEFYGLFSVFNDPDIVQDHEKFTISKNRSKIKYYIADSEAIKSSFTKIKFDDPDVVFNLSSQQLKEIQKMIRIIKAENVTFKVDNDKELVIELTGNDRDNSFENKYELEEVNMDVDESNVLNITIDKEIMELIPDSDYKIHIKQAGVVKFEYVSDKVSLNIYTTEMDEG